MTPDELASAETQLKSGKTATALTIGLVVGISVWTATHRKPFLTFVLLALAIVIARRSAAKMTDIQEERKRRAHAE